MSLDLTDVLDFIINKIAAIFDFMSRIEFLGTNLLIFTITIFIIGAILPVLLTLIKTSNSISERSYKERIRNSDK